MGDFFNEVVVFLEEYYVYAIGVGLIIILMLIGLLASRKKAKHAANAGESMANINEVKTGSINDVANTLQSDVMQPVDVVTFPENNNTTVEEETIPTVVAEPVAKPAETPITNNTVPIVEAPIVNSTPSFVKPVISTDTVKPIVEDLKPIEEVKTVDDEKFDKTEIIDFSAFESPTPAETKEESVIPFTVDNSQYNDIDNMLNGEDSTEGKPQV